MSKVSESYSFDDDKIIVKKTHDANVMLDDARYARDKGDGGGFASDYKHVGNVDMALLNIWLREAGVAWTDTQAVKDVLKRRLMSNEFRSLRVWEGSY